MARPYRSRWAGVGGEGESVKLETQVLITDDGCVRLDRHPWEQWG